MLTYFSKYFKAFEIAMILLCALLLSESASNLLALKFWSPPNPNAATKVVIKPSNDKAKKFDTGAYKMAKEEEAPIEPVAEVEEEPVAEIEEEKTDFSNARKSNMPVDLIGIYHSNIARESVALIKEKSAKDADTYMVDDFILKQAKILKIDRAKVFVDNNGSIEFLILPGYDDQKISPKRPQMVNAPEPEEAETSSKDDKVAKVGKDKYVIDQSLIEDTFSNLSKVATQARIVPFFKDGKTIGFKLFSIKKDSIYSKLGLINSDIITKINGYKMDNPQKFMEVYTKLQSESNITLEIQRNGVKQTKKYNIQ